jgi:hypothetical protein
MFKISTMKNNTNNKTAAAHGISILAIMYAMIILTMLLGMSSCGSSKQYVTCDAYKTHYKPIKAEKHRHHVKCDAYN